VHALLRVLGAEPAFVAGHSAGAAVGARMSLDGLITPQRIVSINGALLPLQGIAFQFFSPIARVLSLNPLVPRFFAWTASDTQRTERLLRDTGSTVDANGLKFYQRLFQRPGHAAGALGMMANWDLPPLERDLPRLQTPLTLIVGSNDRSVPPDDAWRVKAKVAGAMIEVLRGLGHLAHEEKPDIVAELITRLWLQDNAQIQSAASA
jgi:magnesium chelatase accessory protein